VSGAALAAWVAADVVVTWLALALDVGGVSALWPSSGVLLAAFLRVPRRQWPWLILGVLAVHPLPNVFVGRAYPLSLVYAVADVIGVLLPAWLIVRVRGGVTARFTARQSLALSVPALVGGTALGALMATAAWGLTRPAAGRFFLLWWLSTAVGGLVTTPLVLAAVDGRLAYRRSTRAMRLEAALLLAVIGLLSTWLFRSDAMAAVALLLLPYPLLLWLAIRTVPEAAAAGAGLVAVIAIVGTVQGTGPLQYLAPEIDSRALWLQAYLLVTVGMTLLTALVNVERHDAIARLAEREHQYALLAENAEDLIALSDGQSRIRYISPAITRMLGYSVAEAMGRRILDHVHPSDLERLTQRMQRLLDDGGAVQTRYRALHRAGHWVWVEVSARRTTDLDGTPLLVTVTRDIRERVDMEQQLVRAQRLENVGRLAAGLAHDFNNLLAVAQSSTELLTIAAGPTEIAAAVDGVQSAVARGRDITARLMRFARRGDAELHDGDLGRAVADAVRLARPALGPGVSLDAGDTPWGLPARFDAGQVQQVVLNLLFNARDAMPQGGRIRLRMAGLTPPPTDDDAAEWALDPINGVTPVGSHWAVLVEDDGPGVPPALRERIFEPFVTTKAEGQGTGLGLAMVRSIADLHGGRVWCCASPLGGALFVFAVPRTAEPTATPAPRHGTVHPAEAAAG
jgi:PAS domain S-box-containing protein